MTQSRPITRAKDPLKGASWVIFYSPHPDDESIGMGQAIRRYVEAGYAVQVVLLTDGESSDPGHGRERGLPRSPRC